MPADVMDRWLNCNRSADVNGKYLHPLEHKGLKGTPLSIQKGQAEVFCLRAEDGSHWVLKKFHAGRSLAHTYLTGIRSLLPSHPGFVSGTRREVLSSDALHTGNGHYHCPELGEWLDGTILMPRINGIDWSALADRIRDGQQELDRAQRRSLCRSLAELIRLLEMHKLTHRDLSSSNVYIHIDGWLTSLIDFDSLYHPRLTMPVATTCGTPGYVAPYTWQRGGLDPAISWRPGADRYALALLNTEFLALRKGAPLSVDGGMFDQDELCARSGKSVDLARNTLAAEHPQALPLFEAAIKSTSFDSCPSPQDWLSLCGSYVLNPPRLADIEEFRAEDLAALLRRRRPAPPVWPAPLLRDLPPIEPEASAAPTRVAVPSLVSFASPSKTKAPIAGNIP